MGLKILSNRFTIPPEHEQLITRYKSILKFEIITSDRDRGTINIVVKKEFENLYKHKGVADILVELLNPLTFVCVDVTIQNMDVNVSYE